MADISIACPHCGQETVVSEYVDPESMACPSCGQKLALPEEVLAARPRAKEKPKPRVSVHGVSAEDGQPVLPEEVGVTASMATGDRAKRRKRRQRKPRLAALVPSGPVLIVLFVIVTGILCMLRYSGALSGTDKEFLIKIGTGALLIGHLAVTVDAFSDNAMHGLLCLCVPCYSIYFLYAVSDSLFLRFAVGILLLPFGLDAALGTGEVIMGMIAWLRGADMGDGDASEWLRKT